MSPRLLMSLRAATTTGLLIREADGIPIGLSEVKPALLVASAMPSVRPGAVLSGTTLPEGVQNTGFSAPILLEILLDHPETTPSSLIPKASVQVCPGSARRKLAFPSAVQCTARRRPSTTMVHAISPLLLIAFLPPEPGLSLWRTCPSGPFRTVMRPSSQRNGKVRSF